MAEGISGFSTGSLAPIWSLIESILPSKSAAAAPFMKGVDPMSSFASVFDPNATNVAKSPGSAATVPAEVAPTTDPSTALADAIGPWETTVTPAEAEGAAAGKKTFGDKLSEALSGLGALESPAIKAPDPADALAIGRFLLSALPKTELPSLAAALPRRR